MQKPRLIVSAPEAHPASGSEPGKGFAWTKALASFYEIHLICGSPSAEVCKQCRQCDAWIFHTLDTAGLPGPGLRYYEFYHRWCRDLIPKCREIIEEVQPVGLHHPTLGSFRMFPDYFRLGIPYTLGPLGGGETAPTGLLRDAGLPCKELAKERLRPALNYASLLNPQVRRVLQNSRMTLATTQETERLLRWAGATSTAVVFPDVIDLSQTPHTPLANRAGQKEELRREIRCIWSGRFLWWKGGQLAIRFIHRLRQAGCNASLDVYSGGKGIEALPQLAKDLGLEAHVRFNGLVPRHELLQAYLRAHLFVYPTLHDSSSSAIPEAYSAALPSFTLGLGGVRTATDPQAGLNELPPSIEDWLQQGIRLVQEWTAHPDAWLAACSAAHKKSSSFVLESIIAKVREHLQPCFGS